MWTGTTLASAPDDDAYDEQYGRAKLVLCHTMILG
jgi:hypothetical protein